MNWDNIKNTMVRSFREQLKDTGFPDHYAHKLSLWAGTAFDQAVGEQLDRMAEDYEKSEASKG